MDDKTFPLLFAKATTGKIKVWQIRAERDGKLAKIVTSYGYLDSDNLQSATVKVTEGKNIGKKNETTPFGQACAVAESKWKKKQNRNYVENPSGEGSLRLPMLALKFKESSHRMEWPALTQPKLNGVRCLGHKKDRTQIVYTSREANTYYFLEHITEALEPLMEVKATMDGELFNPKLPFEDIISAVRQQKVRSPYAEMIQYWIYDIVLTDTPFKERYDIYKKIIPPAKSLAGVSIIPVPCRYAADEAEVLKLHKIYVAQGYEGTIVRDPNSNYVMQFRVPGLQKHKDMEDAEFDIVGAKEGEGIAEGAVTWICITAHGEEFDVVPNGPYTKRREWWENRNDYIGKKRLTVQFQNLSTDRQVPVFPKGLAVRDYE